MKRIILYISTMLLLLASCGRGDFLMHKLVEIDSLTMTDIDSARAMLREISETMREATDGEQAYYDLLRIKAADKAMVTYTNDSVITQVIDFYEKSNEKHHLAEAYYYAGRVNADIKNGERALIFFHKALLEDSAYVSPHLRSRIYAQLGYSYLRNGLTDDAMNMQQLAYAYCEQVGDSAGMRQCEDDMQEIAATAANIDSLNIDVREKALAVQRINEKVKNQALKKRYQELQERSSHAKSLAVWGALAVGAVLLACTLYIIRRRRLSRTESYEPTSSPQPIHRNFYDKEINELLAAHISEDRPLHQSEWAVIEERLLAAFPTFKDRLYEHFNFSETEYRICLLIKLEASPSNMAKLLATAASTVSQSRLRMQQKVFGGQGTAKDWDRFVLSL